MVIPLMPQIGTGKTSLIHLIVKLCLETSGEGGRLDVPIFGSSLLVSTHCR